MTDFKTLYLADYKAPLFSISTVELTFELADNNTIVTSVLSVKRLGIHQAPLTLNGEKLTLKNVQINDAVLTPQQYKITDSHLVLSPKENEFSVTIITEIDPLNNTSLEGLFKSGSAFCTQCEAEGFRRMTYYLDRPDVMAIFTVTVIADKAQYPYLLSNGNKTSQGDLDNGQHFTTWHDPFPKPCYLFALVAGHFDLLSDNFTTQSGKEVALEIFVDEGNLAKAHHAMASLKHAMRWDETTFNLEYDLDIYMIVAVDFFNMGAMENKGLNVFNSKYVLGDQLSATDTDYFNIEAVIGHEYFHNWTGNRVTCRDWFQLSLKEGLTVFRDQQFSADMHNATVTRIQNVRFLRAQQFAEDTGPMAHPIRPEKVMEMNNFYTLTVYEKGAEVIRMIHTLLGERLFKQGIALYFQRFDGQAVTCDDFVDAMADASGVNLTQFKRWYSQAGTPVLSVCQFFDEVKSEFSLTIKQSIPSQSQIDGRVFQPLHIPINIELIDENTQQSVNQLLELTECEQTWTFKNLTSAPVVAFLGNFSAPVKVDYSQNDDELAIIMSSASDGFSQWDAGQKLLTNYIKKLTNNPNEVLPIALINIFTQLLASNEDKAFIAEQLVLPSFDEIAELIDEVDPIALIKAIETLTLFLAKGLAPLFAKTYKECDKVIQALSSNTAQENKILIANKSLKNRCLFYLAALPDYKNQVVQQFEQAKNMTDTLAALNCSAKYNLTEFKQQMDAFEQQWQTTPLVMDKWFTIQASASNDDIFSRLEQLIAHPLFSLKNPNRARSLISAFAMNNPKYFHCSTGRGYQFLAKHIALLNDINPQVAARLITPLIQYKGVDMVRQQLMKNELIKLRKLPNLSKDLVEKLDAALAS